MLLFSTQVFAQRTPLSVLDSLSRAFSRDDLVVYEHTSVKHLIVDDFIFEECEFSKGIKVTRKVIVTSVFSDSELAFSSDSTWTSYTEILKNLSSFTDDELFNIFNEVAFQEFYRAAVLCRFPMFHPVITYPEVTYKRGYIGKQHTKLAVFCIVDNKSF
jgi:hypothetical protein